MNLELDRRNRPVQPRGLGQRVAFASAMLFYVGALACLIALAIWLEPLGRDHPVIASLAASIVFFIGGGIVLHVIGRADLPNLRPGSLDTVIGAGPLTAEDESSPSR
jgi:predicted tellurium resistance membrane protein TerC